MTVQQLIWRKISNHMQDSMIPLKTISIQNEVFHVRKTSKYYYLVTADETSYSKIEPFEARKLIGDDKPITRGPFEFHYGFEESIDGLYLIKLLPHIFNIAPIAKRKAADIIRTYGKYYVKINYQLYQDMVLSRSYFSSSDWLLTPQEFMDLTGKYLMDRTAKRIK